MFNSESKILYVYIKKSKKRFLHILKVQTKFLFTYLQLVFTTRNDVKSSPNIRNENCEQWVIQIFIFYSK